MTLNIFLTTVELVHNSLVQIFKKTYNGPFSWMGFNSLKAVEPRQGDSLLFSTNSPGTSGTHLIDLGRKKSLLNLDATSCFKN